MMDYKLRFSILALLVIPGLSFGQTDVDFGSVNEKSSTFENVTYNSSTFYKGSGDSVYAYFTLMGGQWFNEAVSSVSKIGAPSGLTGQVQVNFEPKQNIIHKGILLVESEYSVEAIVSLEGQGTFSNTYYSSTRNKSEEALKTALTTLLNNGTTSLGYNRARDNMYATIDNVNGEVECVYTGKKARFNTRSGANNANFNCEHTYPQGFFSRTDPEKSDIHHLFPTTTTSNSRRGNDPFGIVSNASWQDGGSKSGGGKFEPRDAHKGAVARSMLYFVLRHGDFNDGGTPFLTKQETVLRSWHSQFPVSQKEQDRNDAIFTLQKNRSPFVDYPQLLERITKVSGTSNAPAIKKLLLSRNLRDLTVGDIDTATLQAVLYNGGNRDISIKSVSFEKSEMELVGKEIQFPLTIEPGKYLSFRFGSALADRAAFDDNLIIETDAPGSEQLKFNYKGLGVGSGVAQVNSNQLFLYPNPATDAIQIATELVNREKCVVEIFSFTGEKLITDVLEDEFIDVHSLKPSVYSIVIRSEGEPIYTGKFTKQ